MLNNKFLAFLFLVAFALLESLPLFAQVNRPAYEVSLTEAANTPQAHTNTTQWHPQFNLPVRIVEPDRETVMIYDSRGQLTTKTTQLRSM